MHIKTLELYTAALPQLRFFYADVLKCTVTADAAGFTLHAGTTKIIFRESSAGNPRYHFAFTIPWNKVAEALRWTADRVPLLPLPGGQFLADFRAWDAQAFYFQDPAGNIVEFIGREPLGITSESPFSGNSLASLSEIGLVTDNVPLACRQLEELWAVPIFSKQPPAPQFAAAGDDHGLFIVVQEGRPWFPTTTLAEKAPFKAAYETGDSLLRTLSVG